jgi:MYXO-CTERM domain-containing protein
MNILNSVSAFAVAGIVASFGLETRAIASMVTEQAQFQDYRTIRYGSTDWTYSGEDDQSQASQSFVGPVYDSSNFATSGATGFGVGATSSTDLASIYGDQTVMVNGAGSTLDSMKFGIFCSGSSTANLTSADVNLKFYRGTDGSFIGGYSVSIGALAKGFYAVVTVTDLASLGINFDVNNVIVTQQLTNVLGATRMGTVFSNASNTPALGSTNIGMYIQNTTNPAGGFFTFTGAATASSAAYQMSTVPAPGAVALLGVAGLVSARRRR